MSNVWFILYSKKLKRFLKPVPCTTAANFYTSLPELISGARNCDNISSSDSRFAYFLVCNKPYIAIKV